jgi:hypothetical protein
MILKKTQINVYAIKMLIIVLKCLILLSSAYINFNLGVRNFTVNTERQVVWVLRTGTGDL